MRFRPDKVRCDECGSEMLSDAVREAFIDHPKPGHDRISLCQCPECGEVNCFTQLCDVERCSQPSTCGFPTLIGTYMRTCGKHWDELKDLRTK